MITFARRAKARETPTARIRRWVAINAPIAVDEIKSKYHLPTYFAVVRREPNGSEYVLSRHRKKTAAERAAHKAIAT